MIRWMQLGVVGLGVALGGLLAPGCVVTTNQPCLQVNGLCSVDADCCGDLICDAQGYCAAPNTNCVADNDACNVDADCCGNFCAIDGFCGPIACLGDGAVCAGHADCCAGFCDVDGLCGAGSCLPDDAACTTDFECCTNFCAADGFCGFANCSADNVACSFDSECCSGICDTDGFCGLSGMCLVDGSSCGVAADCCSGNCDGNLCAPCVKCAEAITTGGNTCGDGTANDSTAILNDYVTCVCGAGLCDVDCADSFCAAQPSLPSDPSACQTCLNDVGALGAACEAEFGSCAGDI